jgi:glycosyltransferase involved in cell wall biosynthesis
LIAPAFEDYGLTPLEAAGLGTPTLALRRGGYLDTVVESVSGYFFEDLDRRSISVAIDELDTQPLDPAEIREHASRFSEQEFARALREQVSVHLA